MKKNLNNQKGIAFIAVIIVLIVAVIAGGAAYLGIRMLITGDSFLAPFEELGWINSDKENDDNEKENKVEDKKDTEQDEDETSSSVSLVRKDRLSDEAKSSGTTHYYGKLSMADSDDVDPSDENYELYKLLTMEVDMYTKADKVVEIVFTVNMKDFLKGMYDEYEEEMGSSGYSSYEEFETAMVPYFEKSFDMGLSSSLDDETSQYIETYKDNGLIQIYMTEKGFEQLYDNYGIEEGTNDIDTIKSALEKSLDIKIEKVK